MNLPGEPLEPKRCAAALRALADPDRLRIVTCLRGGPSNVSDLAQALQIELVNLSHHLGVLRHAGIVQTEKQGRFVIYSLPPNFFTPTPRSSAADFLNLGCCRLEIPKRRKASEES
jgi:DNA-binding transcriptional ArsR family regulator